MDFKNRVSFPSPLTLTESAPPLTEWSGEEGCEGGRPITCDVDRPTCQPRDVKCKVHMYSTIHESTCHSPEKHLNYEALESYSHSKTTRFLFIKTLKNK